MSGGPVSVLEGTVPAAGADVETMGEGLAHMSADPWNGVVAALGGDATATPAACNTSRRHRLMLPAEIRGAGRDTEPSSAELRLLELVAERPHTASELAAALQLDMRAACNRIARMRVRGLIERTARGWQAVEIGLRPPAGRSTDR